MSSETATLEIPGVGRLAQLELTETLGNNSVTIVREKGRQDDYGELALATAIVIVSLKALNDLSIWLAKKRERTVVRTVKTRIDPDGTRHETATEIVITAEMSQPEVLKALGEATHVDVKPLLEQSA